jgi:UDP-N-acetyl-D-glucosamine dehydrogenase
VRESPALDVIELLKRRGAIVTYSDPYVQTLEHGAHNLKGISIKEAVGAATDCAVIVTDHKAFDYPGIVASFPLVVDTRNALKGIKNEKIFAL